MPRWLGIDWGARRIGVALSDLEGLQAFGYTTLDSRDRDPIGRILAICDDEDVGWIVLGLPLRSDTGEESQTAKAVREFSESLAARTRIPLRFEDERFSSFAAEQDLKAAGWRPGKDPKGLVDKAAAKVLLQDFLDRRARGETTE
ncbi:MAG: Holliday junction resolvase RuvX [Fibrobacteres bacterium]|nr:Holliday junction resolvase RuvX [Fibrobacterota bacterium]